MDAYFKCPCGEVLHEPEEKAGSTVKCSRCGRRLVIPRVPVAASVAPDSESGEGLGVSDIAEAQEAPRSTENKQAQEAGQPQEIEGDEAKEVGDLVYPDPGAEACKPRTGINGLAVASLVLGLTSPFLGILSIVAGILAIVFGSTAIKAMSKNPALTGKGMAIAGIALGSMSVLLWLLMFFAMQSEQPPSGDSLDVLRLTWQTWLTSL